jgi:hypothetical protein
MPAFMALAAKTSGTAVSLIIPQNRIQSRKASMGSALSSVVRSLFISCCNSEVFVETRFFALRGLGRGFGLGTSLGLFKGIV